MSFSCPSIATLATRDGGFVSGNSYDAIVIGGGPAGSSFSAVLAQKGRRARFHEKERFPGDHIVEPRIPDTYFPLKRSGLMDKMKKSNCPKKYSEQFVSMDGRASLPFYFFSHLKHEAANTWQVLRSEFDQMLMNNAREKGAEVREEITVRELIRENGAVVGVKATDKDGQRLEFRAPFTIDATGRDAFTVTRNGWKVRDPELNKIAVWTYYKGAMRDPGVDEGATTVAYLPGKGWFWYIPLPDDVLSVGVVAEKDYLYRDTRDLETIFLREVDNNVWIKKHVEVGKQFGPYRVTGEYSYRSRYCAENGLVLVGDAFAFLDPVFSSGVFIALRSGEMAADAVDEALKAGDVSASRFTEYGSELCRGIEAMRSLVYAFYDHEFHFRKFFDVYPSFKGDLTDCLMGNLFIDFQPLFAAAAEFAKIPPPLSHGKPFMNEPLVAV